MVQLCTELLANYFVVMITYLRVHVDQVARPFELLLFVLYIFHITYIALFQLMSYVYVKLNKLLIAEEYFTGSFGGSIE